MSLQTEIGKTFNLDGTQADVVRELESLCNVYRLTPDQLRMKWEAFALSSQIDLTPTAPYVKILKNSLQREFERGLKTRRTVKGKVTTKRAESNQISFSDYGLEIEQPVQEESVDDFMSNLIGGIGGGLATVTVPKTTTTPRQVRRTLPFAPQQSNSSLNDTQMSGISSQFINRKSAHVIETQYNSHLPLPITNDTDVDIDIESEFTFAHIEKPIEPYRYMYERLKDKSSGIDERIDYIGGTIKETYKIEAFGNPTRPSQEAIYAYGLISSDTSEGKLNEKSIILQTSRDVGMGRRIPLDLSKIDSYSFFPGQIIGMKGINHSGYKFHVDEILLPPTPEKAEYEIKINKTLDMITSAGPFTLDDDLSFSPLEELLSKCKEQRPDVILLMGPFLSIHHPKIANATIDTLPEQIFKDQVLTRLEQLLEECKKTNIFLMPHPNDIIQTWPLFPQPPLVQLNIKHDRIHLISNPSSILMNGHSLSIGNIDTLFRLGKEEISKNPALTDRFSRLTQHILQQHSYYPLLPHALGDNIDAGCLPDLHIVNTPDILILPSQFKHFIKSVDDTICINPGYLCKHQAGGTYARVILYPTQKSDERIRVDLLKL